MLGRTIQNYRIEQLLGEGGMGTVYKATDLSLRRPVAVKMLHAHLVRNKIFMERFENEAVLSAQLNHPNVATLYNFFQDYQFNLIVMEFVDGMTLEQVLKRNGSLPFQTAVKIVIQTIDGLLNAHQRNILHRDIKAANVMLTAAGNIKLMDFGIARLVGSERITRMDRVVGTLEYMAPELLGGAAPSVQSDLYAVGVLLYELLSGHMPFQSATESALITQILLQKPLPLKNRTTNLPAKIEEIIFKLLEKKPEKRFQTASELRFALVSIVLPGNIDMHMLSALDGGTSVSHHPASRPMEPPTRLVPSGVPTMRPFYFDWFSDNLFTIEGAILGFALLIATAVISYGLMSPPSGSSQQRQNFDSLAVIAEKPVPQIKESGVLDSGKSDALAAYPDVTVKRPAVKIELEEIPEQQYVPPARKKKQVAESVVVSEIRDVEKSKPEPVRETVKPAKMVSVQLKGATLNARFVTALSTENSRQGQTFYLEVVAPLIVDGITVVQSGAQLKGIVEKVISKSESKRAGLWFRLLAVQAINGSWLNIDLKWSDTAFHAIELKEGFVFKKIKIERTSIELAQY
ncbi:serine/threonine-protein kinase [Dyadobacter psychrotolerans]|uniref:non-specific serine/threonine protein kinase n=1 Tax=Dyadobacter psychrotolerans TaxID=2541721 RepID=A0A4R5DXP1_9BACT|nr:serine/threonine-protein kinase [Dyadobacter psychrotolerans]TDE17240.1 serine/threonine protein kinase [Dyadobacter psychrotolerans]